MQAVTIWKSSYVTVRNITLVDSPQMHINFQYVNVGHARAIKVQAPWSSPNTDGIHVSSTTNFAIQDCNVSTGHLLNPITFQHSCTPPLISLVKM